MHVWTEKKARNKRSASGWYSTWGRAGVIYPDIIRIHPLQSIVWTEIRISMRITGSKQCIATKNRLTQGGCCFFVLPLSGHGSWGNTSVSISGNFNPDRDVTYSVNAKQMRIISGRSRINQSIMWTQNKSGYNADNFGSRINHSICEHAKTHKLRTKSLVLIRC